MKVKYRLWPNGIPPRCVQVKVPGWAGESTYEMPQPWHCKPFLDGSGYGLELLYPWQTECVVTVDEHGTCTFEGDFSNEAPADFPKDWMPFDCFAEGFFGLICGIDLQPDEGIGMLTLPHPRFYTDRTGTVPLAICGLIEKDWWPHVFFLVFKVPPFGQRTIFRHGDPITQIIFVPQQEKYEVEEMSTEEAASRCRRDANVRAHWKEFSNRIFYCGNNAAFDNKYKCLSRIAHTQGTEKVLEVMDDVTKLPDYGNDPNIIGQSVDDEQSSDG